MKLKKALPVKLIFTLLGIVAIYFIVSIHYQNVFLPNTTYSGVNISGKTPEAANKLLKHRLSEQQYKVVEQQKTILSFTGKDLNIRHNYLTQLQNLKANQNPWAWSLTVFAAGSEDAASNSQLKLDQQKADQLYEKLVAETKANRTETKNASITKSGASFKIVKEVYGNNIDEAKLKKEIIRSIDSGQTDIDLKKAYVTPTVLSDDSTLTKDLKQLETIHNENITYKIFGSTEKVAKSEIYKWLEYENGEIKLNTTAVSNYVSELSSKYGTISKTRSFKTTGGSTVDVPAGIYGWSIKRTSEVAALSKEVLKGQDFTRTPITQGFGYNDNGTDIGDTYVEVSKSAQHMWVYKNGSLIISTDVVTGKPGQDTPSGVFAVWSRERNTSLKGKNSDGSDYNSPVSYWMPIDYTGVGIHDSSWQPQYGGTWYIEHGSHGCINTPPSVMSQVYENVGVNTPVIVY
ncbi:L,D-transpeptidase family protein [Agrilactobacillus yilanensis]|uniref:L,D-transpeptidase family protein n=1 Tax=Agrilactobacillus yilanensis TaxID=2485997 RepID=A0ABW4J2K4_9LACO|nr:L,D-transpeptidase family protein [Agrilactobacillus yilanensis]